MVHLVIQEIAEKEFTLEPSKTGLVKVLLSKEERKRQVLNKDEIKILVKYALKMDRKYGPQEIEFAILRTGQLIFQASRDANLKKFNKTPVKNYPIFPRDIDGEIVQLEKEMPHSNLSQKIIVTGNLDIDLITNLTSQNKPAGIILTRGSLTAHAVTIIREAKIPSVLVKNINLTGKKFAKIKKTGEVELL